MSTNLSDNTASSASQLMGLLSALQNTGSQVLAAMAQVQQDTLFRFEQDFNALTSRRQRAVRLLSPDIACRFITSDFLDIDQTLTSAAVRADSQAVTLRESTTLVEANIKSTVFSSATGTVNQFGDMYQVSLTDDSMPTGIFELQLYNAQALTLLVFDATMPPGTPVIQVYGSQTGVTWEAAAGVSQNGSRVNAWFNNQSFQYLRVEITPTHPDTLSGTAFTFGLSNLNVYIVDYQLYSEFVSKPVMIAPVTSQVRFRAPAGLNYYLTLGDQLPQKVNPDDILSLPGVTDVAQNTQINTSWVLCPTGSQNPYMLPASIYPSSLDVLDVAANEYMNVAYGLDPTQLQPGLTHEYVGVQEVNLQWQLLRVPIINGDFSNESGRTFQVIYVQGPAQVPATLRVQLSSANRALTPIFTGAYLENVY